MENVRKLLGLTIIAVALMSAGSAKAWYDSDGNWHSERIRHVEQNRVVFRDSDRIVLKNYITTNSVRCSDRDHRRHCVERRTNSVFYHPGMTLPQTVIYRPLPSTVTTRLTPAPEGTVYVHANDDVYLINRKNRAIIDAVDFSDVR